MKSCSCSVLPDALAVLQLTERGLHHLRQVVRQVSVGDARVIVLWVLRHPAVDECPREKVHGILLILDSDNLRIKMIAQAVVQMTLYREKLVQKLVKEILLQHTLGICVQ